MSLWYTPSPKRWYITVSKGSYGTDYWESPTEDILGTYVPQGGATGNPVVSLPVQSFTSVGGTAPVSAGAYILTGQWEGFDYFYAAVNGMNIWYDNMSYEWIISSVVGTKGANWWASPAISILGTYTPGGSATGNPVVSITA